MDGPAGIRVAVHLDGHAGAAPLAHRDHWGAPPVVAHCGPPTRPPDPPTAAPAPGSRIDSETARRGAAGPPRPSRRRQEAPGGVGSERAQPETGGEEACP